MRHKLVFLLVLFSIGLNVAFVGAWAVGTVSGRSPHAPHTQPTAEPGQPWCSLHRRLGVTAEQWRRLEPRIAAFCDRARLVRQDVHRKRREMIDLIAAEPADRQVIAAKQAEILACQQRKLHLVVEQLLTEKELLTPSQQKQLFDLIRQHGPCAGRVPLVRWLGGKAGGRSAAATCPTRPRDESLRGVKGDPSR